MSTPNERLHNGLTGFEYPDGATVTNVTAARGRAVAAPAGTDSTQPWLMPRGSSGGDREYTQSWWLTPLPPSGPLRAVFRWSAMGLPETTVELDGTALAEAGQRTQVLWPLEADPAPHGPTPPQLPDSGWFAKAAHTPDPDTDAGRPT